MVKDYEQNACPTCGSCSGMFTANSMNCLAEALGMALPGNGTALATSPERLRLYRRAAEQIMELVKCDIKPRDIATLAAFDNAMMLDMAMGGSTNTQLHVLAIAREAGIEYDVARINALSLKTPNISKVAPGHSRRENLPHSGRASGGRYSYHLGSLRRGWPELLNTECLTVTGKTLARISIVTMHAAIEFPPKRLPCTSRVRSPRARAWTRSGQKCLPPRARLPPGQRPPDSPIPVSRKRGIGILST
jgi:dihydroxy-acid dehydratase